MDTELSCVADWQVVCLHARISVGTSYKTCGCNIVDTFVSHWPTVQASESKVASLSTELSVTRDELSRASAVASRAATAEAKLVKSEGMVPAGEC